jgi:transaldolase
MRLYLDSADAAELARVLPSPLVAGVTTNPTLLKRAGLAWDALPDFVRRVEQLGVRTVHVQVRHADADGMLRDAAGYRTLGSLAEVIVKLPATRAGYAAAAALAADGVPVTTTAVSEPEQVLWSLRVGARYAAPYLGRMDEAGRDGQAVIRAMQGVVRAYASPGGESLRLLVASIRSPEAFRDLLQLGVGAATVPVALFERLTQHEVTLAAERAFLADAS